MASVQREKGSGFFYIRFRYGGRPFRRSLKTTNEREAEAVKGRVEETIILLERGRLEIPPEAEPGTYILSDGKRNGKVVPSVVVRTLSQLFKSFQQQRLPGVKEEHTIRGEDRHIKHLLRILGGSTVAQE